MRITFLIANSEGGSGGDKVIAEHARYLIDQGHEVTLVGTPPRRPGVASILRALRHGNTYPLLKRLFPGRPKLGEHYAAANLSVCRLPYFRPIRNADVPDADIVIGTWWETAEWMLKLSPEKGVKVHFVQDYEAFPYLPQDRVHAVHDSDCVKITVSTWLADKLKREHGANLVLCVENTVNISGFSPGTSGSGGPFTVGFIISPTPRKRSDLAIVAAETLREKISGLRVLTFGSEVVGGSSIPNWFDHHTRPPQSEIHSLYRACDVWLWTSETEGFGLPILEALACGVPVVATRAGAAPDLITPDCGVLVTGEVETIVDAIRNLAADPERLQQMKKAARRRAEEVCATPAGAVFERTLYEILAGSEPALPPIIEGKEVSA